MTASSKQLERIADILERIDAKLAPTQPFDAQPVAPVTLPIASPYTPPAGVVAAQDGPKVEGLLQNLWAAPDAPVDDDVSHEPRPSSQSYLTTYIKDPRDF